MMKKYKVILVLVSFTLLKGRPSINFLFSETDWQEICQLYLIRRQLGVLVQ
jgi:hypothetical protein